MKDDDLELRPSPVLRALLAPPTERELDGADGARAMFLREQGHSRFGHGLRLVGHTGLAAGVGAALVSVGGLTAAAYTGTLPHPVTSVSHRLFGHPADRGTRPTEALRMPHVHVVLPSRPWIHGTSTTLGVVAGPEHAGRVLLVQRLVGGQWVTVTSAVFDEGGRALPVITLPGPGKVKLRVTVPGDEHYLTAMTEPSELDVR
jgi:hypothetical protein